MIYRIKIMNKEFHAIDPKEVVLDFGSGIKGTIELLPCDCCKHKYFILRISKERFIEIPIDILAEPMKTIVQELLKAQEEANE